MPVTSSVARQPPQEAPLDNEDVTESEVWRIESISSIRHKAREIERGSEGIKGQSHCGGGVQVYVAEVRVGGRV